MSIKTFPPVVFLTVGGSDTDEFLITSLNTTEALGDESKKIVGIYKFVEAYNLVDRLPFRMKRRSKKTS